jgi:hypothetical protein
MDSASGREYFIVFFERNILQLLMLKQKVYSVSFSNLYTRADKRENSIEISII